MLNILDHGLRHDVPEGEISFSHQPDFCARDIILKRIVVSHTSVKIDCAPERYA